MSYTDYGADVNNCFEIECFDNNDQVAALTERSNSPLNEIYKPIASKNGYGCVSVFNEEMVQTIDKFFECHLNVSEAARQLYIHRNTLVYRLDKVQRATGLDLRAFDDAITFKLLRMLGRVNENPRPA